MRLSLVWLVLASACSFPRAAPATPRAAEEAPEAGPVKFPFAVRKEAPPGVDVERIYDLGRNDDAPMLGAADAKVTVEVCSDFECPYCAQLAPTVHDLHENYEELVKITWRNCPLPMHEHALMAAEAALEVQLQKGSAAFWAFHDLVFAHQHQLSEDGLVSLAARVEGVSAEKVHEALVDRRHAEHVRKELIAVIDSGAAAGGLGTPTVFVNGRMLAGAQPYPVFEDAVERALQELPEARERALQQSKQAYPMARLRHLLVQYKGATASDARITRTRGQAHERIVALRAQLVQQGVAQFAELARKDSDCPSAREGAELGRFTIGELEQSTELTIFAMEPGQVSEPVETPFGYHLILREE